MKEAGDDPQALAARLYALINAAWTTRALAVAAKLRLVDVCTEPSDAASLAAKVRCDASALERLLRALCAIGICNARDDGAFEITPLGKLLAEDSPHSLRAWSLQFGERLWPAWAELDESVRTGLGTRERAGLAHGFAHLDQDPQAAAVFNRAMVDITRIVSADAVKHLDLAGATRFVDIGGGHGQLLVAFLQRWPRAEGIVFDLAHAQSGAVQHLAENGVGDRARFLAGNFFVDVPSGDVMLLKAILHDWNDERGTQILRSCRRALAPGGRLIVVDRLLPDRIEDDERHRDLVRSDLTMLIGVGGRERTYTEFTRLLDAGGFTVATVHELVLGLAMLECRAD